MQLILILKIGIFIGERSLLPVLVAPCKSLRLYAITALRLLALFLHACYDKPGDRPIASLNLSANGEVILLVISNREPRTHAHTHRFTNAARSLAHAHMRSAHAHPP
eukprot:1562981-Pleurochrysis_carterae.AAC.1